MSNPKPFDLIEEHRGCKIWFTGKKHRGYTCELPSNAPSRTADTKSLETCRNLINHFLAKVENE